MTDLKALRAMNPTTYKVWNAILHLAGPQPIDEFKASHTDIVMLTGLSVPTIVVARQWLIKDRRLRKGSTPGVYRLI